MAKKAACRLVLVEWEDSTQPTSAWEMRRDVKPVVVKIASVGWLIKDGKRIKTLAPNVGGVDRKVVAQCSGVINIPSGCVIAIHDLVEKD